MCVSSTVTSFGQSCFFTVSKLLNHLLHFLKKSVWNWNFLISAIWIFEIGFPVLTYPAQNQQYFLNLKKLKYFFNFFALPDDFSKFPVGAMRKKSKSNLQKKKGKMPDPSLLRNDTNFELWLGGQAMILSFTNKVDCKMSQISQNLQARYDKRGYMYVHTY